MVKRGGQLPHGEVCATRGGLRRAYLAPGNRPRCDRPLNVLRRRPQLDVAPRSSPAGAQTGARGGGLLDPIWTLSRDGRAGPTPRPRKSARKRAICSTFTRMARAAIEPATPLIFSVA